MSSTNPLHDPHIETRQKLDVEIAQLETRLVSLKLARNALAPITRLHPEILQDVFYQTHITSPHKGKATLLLSWISHTWRILAHDTSSLWSQIDFRNVEWVESALSRTKDRELEFKLDGTSKCINIRDLSPLIPYTLGNLSRIKKTPDRVKGIIIIPLESTGVVESCTLSRRSTSSSHVPSSQRLFGGGSTTSITSSRFLYCRLGNLSHQQQRSEDSHRDIPFPSSPYQSPHRDSTGHITHDRRDTIPTPLYADLLQEAS